MLTIEPKTHDELYEDVHFLETPLPGEADLFAEEGAADERERIDEQIMAALVSP